MDFTIEVIYLIYYPLSSLLSYYLANLVLASNKLRTFDFNDLGFRFEVIKLRF